MKKCVFFSISSSSTTNTVLIVLIDILLLPNNSFVKLNLMFCSIFADNRKFAIQYIQNRTGKRRLLINGYVFGRSNEYGDRTIWRCNQYREIG